MSDRLAILAVTLAACSVLLAAPFVAAGELTIQGYASLRGVEVESQPSHREAGFGRLALGAGEPGDRATFGIARLHLTLDWLAAIAAGNSTFGAFLHTVARAEPDSLEGRELGIVEAYLHGELPAGDRGSLGLRLGHFILPTSRENVEFAWSSPYTLTFSALNSWIGEELRTTGLLTEYSLFLPPSGIDEIRLAGTVFGGNDATGALLAWRGWGLGDRLTAFDEVVPLPPLRSLAPGGAFADQLDAGTRPFGSDLDGRPGWAAYLRWKRPGKALIQLTHFDNRGDRKFHNSEEYSWTTRVDILGGELHLGPSFSLVAEALRGATGMGDVAGPHVQADLETAYLLASWYPGRFRCSLRYDTFETRDVDRSGADGNDEDGDAWTLAIFWEPHDDLRLGVEMLQLEGTRPAAESGFGPDADASSLTLEIRYYFGER